ncbi:MAG: hypothetical protein JWM99_1418 [Verrucomicrobiales bacterium]|nr:hypothetical protein [Verrucomicrobiales bacterium]
MQSGHPILGVPRLGNFTVFDLVNIHRLDCHSPVFRPIPQEGAFLRTGDHGANDDLVTILENIFDLDAQVREGRPKFNENLFRAFRSRRLGRRGRNVPPVPGQHLIEDCRIILLECSIPAGDDLLLVVHHLFEVIFVGLCLLCGCARAQSNAQKEC